MQHMCSNCPSPLFHSVKTYNLQALALFLAPSMQSSIYMNLSYLSVKLSEVSTLCEMLGYECTCIYVGICVTDQYL